MTQYHASQLVSVPTRRPDKMLDQTIHGYGHTMEAAVAALNDMMLRYSLTGYRIGKPKIVQV